MLKRSVMQMFTRMMSPPPPTPWMARAAINMPMLTLVAASRLPTKNTLEATSRMGLRPQMSEILPQDGTLAALASRYADPIHVYPAFEWKYALMVGSAVVTMVVSRAARKTEAQSESTMMLVWSVVRESSGLEGARLRAAGRGAGRGAGTGAGAGTSTSLSSLLLD